MARLPPAPKLVKWYYQFAACTRIAGSSPASFHMPTTIAAIRATPVTVPLTAPLLHSNGAHWGRFVRTIVEVETSDGYVGLGEMGGGRI